MRLTKLLLAGAVISTIALSQPASAQTQTRDESAPIVVAQQDDNKDKNKNKNNNKQNENNKGQNQRQEQRQDRREDRQNQRQGDQNKDRREQRGQNQDQQPNQDRREQRGQNQNQQPNQDRRERRQEQNQEQNQQQRQDQQKQQREQRQESQKQQEQKRQEQQNQRREERERDVQKKQEERQRGDKQRDGDKQRGEQNRDSRDDRKDGRDDRKDGRDNRRDDRKEGRDERRDDRKEGRDDRRDERRDDRKEGRDDRRDDRREGRDDRQDRRDDRRGDDRAKRLDDVRGDRRERREGNRTIIEEGNRTIVRDGNRTFIRRDEGDRFRRGRDVNVQRVGGETRTFAVGPNGVRVVTVTDTNGRLLRRSRFVDGREVIIIDNRARGGRRFDDFFIALPPPVIRIPRERYIVEADGAPPEFIYGALMAPPVEPITRAYTLDEIRYSPAVRDRMPRVDLDTITFESGSWEVTPDQYDRIAPIAEGITRAVAQNPNEVFLIEGHTDATGTDDDNLSLSDRRAESVSVILTDQFKIPPENLTTQGYGEQQLKVQSEGPERVNRRVTVRRITPLLQQGQAGAGAPPPQ